jgi:hypothetical protein
MSKFFLPFTLLAFFIPLTSFSKSRELRADDIQIVFADLQPSLISQSNTVPPKRIAAAALALAKVADLLKIPMTFSVVPIGGKPAEIIPELRAYAKDTTIFSRTMMSPFLDPNFVAAIKKNKRKTLVILGYATEVVVIHSALGGLRSGYYVQVPVDGIGGISERTEQAVLRQIEKSGGTTTSVLTLATSLAPDFSRPPGSKMFEAILPLLERETN